MAAKRKFTFTDLPGGAAATGIELNAIAGAIAYLIPETCASCGPETGFAGCVACAGELIAVFLLDFFAWFIQFFGAGRPRVGPDSATDCIALFLIPSSNPVIANWGIGIRMLEGLGCAISGAGPCLTAYENLARAVQHDLELQFPGRELLVKGDPWTTSGAKLFAQYSEVIFGSGNPCASRIAIADRVYLDKFYTDDITRGRLDKQSGFPKCGAGLWFNIESPIGKTQCLPNPCCR